MITVLPERDKSEIEKIFAEKGIIFTEDSGVVTAKCKDDVLGMCLYRLDKKRMIILYIEPIDDILLADGILRSTLHVAAESFVTDAFYDEKTDSEIFKKLCFIKDEKERRLDIDKLFGGCNCKK